MGDLILHYHNKSILDSLIAGDLIECPRGAYSHWGVYIGNGKVVHLTGVGNADVQSSVQPEHMFSICGKMFTKAQVCVDDFWKVVADSKARKNNTKDGTWSPCSRAEIVRNAISKVGHVGYNLLFSNCEHFAKWCRYGLSKSDQVDNVLTAAAVGLATVGFLGLVYGLARYFRSDENEEEQKQKVTANK
ncbi:hypothetical protein BsWGS_23500 [Bradybaena similaris]